MDEFFEIIKEILSWSVTPIATVLTVAIPLRVNRKNRKEEKRPNVTIGILDNRFDDIDKKLKIDSCQWFLDIDKMKSYIDENLHHYAYVMINGEYGAHKWELYTNVKTKSQGDDTKKIPLGTLNSKRTAIVPIDFTNDVNRISFLLTYETQGKEEMLYEIIYSFDKNNISGISEINYVRTKKEKSKKSKVKKYLSDKHVQFKTISKEDVRVVHSYSGEIITGKIKSISSTATLNHRDNRSKIENKTVENSKS